MKKMFVCLAALAVVFSLAATPVFAAGHGQNHGGGHHGGNSGSCANVETCPYSGQCPYKGDCPYGCSYNGTQPQDSTGTQGTADVRQGGETAGSARTDRSIRNSGWGALCVRNGSCVAIL